MPAVAAIPATAVVKADVLLSVAFPIFHINAAAICDVVLSTMSRFIVVIFDDIAPLAMVAA